MTDTVDDASQGVVDTTEPGALPDTNALASGQGDAAGSPAIAEAPGGTPPAAEPAPKTEPWFVKRLDRQRQDLAERDRTIADLRRQVAGGQGGVPGAAQPQAGDRQPSPADFDRSVQERAGQLAAARAFDEDCNSIAAAGSKAHPDFMEAVANLNRVGSITPGLIEAVKEAGDQASLLYQLGKDPAEAERILALSPARMGAALAKLAAKAPAPTPVSRAPAPLSPVAGTARVETDPDKMSMEDYVKWRDAQDAKRK